MPFYVLKGKRYEFMKVKKWLLGLVTFAAMVVLCVVCAGAETYGDFEYGVLDDGTVQITAYNGSAETVVIPDTIDGKSVTSIGAWVFSGFTSLTSITIPDSVTSIGESAFNGCTSLTSITIPDGVTSIGDDAFSGCSSLTSITIPDSVTSIGYGAFNGCTSLTNITIPDSVTSIGYGAFNGCTSLTSITIPNGVTSIGGSAFEGTALLDKQTTPVKYADSWVVNCDSDVENVMIKSGTKGIANSAFSWCSSLKSITIPDSVTSIGESAFDSCSNLTAIDVEVGNNNYTSVNGVLFNKDKTELICYPAGKTDKSYNIPDSVTSIGDSAFEDCTSLTSITIPNGVTSIGDLAFYGCRSLTSIMIPSSVTCIGDSAFEYCSSLTSITIPNSVTSIGDWAFGYCKSLTSITIPNGVTSIGGWAFSGCTSIKSITIPNSVTSIGNVAFSDCTSLTSITIPNSVTEIGSSAFSRCTSLTSITIPDSVTSIGESAFSSCSSLTVIDVEVGNSNYTSVNGVLFNKDKTELICYPAGKTDKSYNIPDSVTSIGWYAFSGCTSLTNITIPDSVTSIGRYAFSGCTSLTSITIPNSVTSIGKYAFGFYFDNNTYNYTKYNNFKIYCYSGTVGKLYAMNNDFECVLLDKLPTLAKVSGVKLGGRAADALRINWTKNANADGYIVEMYQGNKWVRVSKITNNNTTTFRKAGLKAGTVYNFRVKAYKMYGSTAAYSDYSAELAARTNPSVMKGAKLTGRAADALRINWTKNTSADGYIVEMYQGGKWVRVAKITKNSTTTFRKAGLKASSVYKFRVRAYKMSGKTALYGNYSATVTARTNPSVVKGVKIGGKAKDALRVNWAKNSSAQGYIVEMYKGGKWVRVAKITNGNTTTFRKAGLAKNTTYKFRVKAYYMSGKTALYGNYGSVSGKTAAK